MASTIANRDRLVIIATAVAAALVGVLGVVFAQTDQVERVANHATAVGDTERALTAVAELRSNIGIGLVLASAAQGGVDVQETPALALAESRRSLADLTLAAALVDDDAVATLAEAVPDELETVALAIEAGDLETANRLARSQLLPSLVQLDVALRTHSRTQTEIISIEGSSAGDVARAASLAVALMVPAFAVLVVRRSLRKRAERQVLEIELANQREQNEARDELIASLAHQIRTPLSGVYGFAEAMFDLLKSGGADQEFLEEAANTIFGQSFEIRRLIDDLMVATRSDAGLLEKSIVEIDVTRAASAAVEPFIKSGLEPNLDIDPGRAMADSLRLQHILRNLLHNAVTHGGERITITGRDHGDRYTIAIGDDGSGLGSDDDFSPFLVRGTGARTSGALGLGLSVARSLTELMDGELVYERADDTSWFVLSLSSAANGDEPISSESPSEQLSAH